ncbi:hypothetical protein GCM10023321_84820 [Pseudonocardia eucalypti]|uniref:Oxidoreductase n=1 Tax=Pseudonocardia eucalypti TaxID=648755 RepID=A0ABP9RG99_9PSEU|nr:hypothetical protein [Pseudonocardia eucalypti]
MTGGVPTPAARRPRPRAVVLGAGIAGLTAAHELAERGFQVTVYERRLDERTGGDHPVVKLGGLAASQFATAGGGRARLRPFPGRSGATPPGRAVAGEHGFRLFPAYYLHIWDLLQQIPCYVPSGTDRDGRTVWRPTGRTVMDNVRRVISAATTLPGKPSLIFSRAAPRSAAELVTTAGQLGELGFTPADVQTFLGRLARYVTTSPPRRAAELANRSAYDFFTADGCTYTPATEALMLEMPKVLAAFDSRWGDARTNLNTYLQLLLHLDRGEGKADGVLDGPTTEAWFDHWYRHLTALGVRFVPGEVRELEPPRAGGNLPPHRRPRVTAVLADGTRITPDYLVVAVDAPTAERITGTLRRAGTGGAVAGLDGFTTSLAPPKSPLQASAERPAGRRDPYAMSETGRVPWDRFQTLTGIQFYFDTEFQLVRGHVYYSGTEWHLSSINQRAMWAERPELARDGFVSVLSVDIGDFNTPSGVNGKAARDCTTDELAAEVWRQISDALTSGLAGGAGMGRAPSSAPDGNTAGPPETRLPTPAWYALDRYLVLADDPDGNGRPVRNEAPYLVPVVGDWDNRPEGEPWNPNGTSWMTRPTEERRREDLERRHTWRAGHGGYPMHHNSVVLAGTWTRTFTRMTSMEAACESARHAVNALLDHYIWVESGGTDPRDDTALDWRFPFDFLDQGYSGPVRQPTPAGDYCYVFDLEDREPLDARGPRNLDGECYLAGLPHPLAALSALSAPTLPTLPVPPTGGQPLPSPEDYTSHLLTYLQAWRQYLEQATHWPAPPPPAAPPSATTPPSPPSPTFPTAPPSPTFPTAPPSPPDPPDPTACGDPPASETPPAPEATGTPARRPGSAFRAARLPSPPVTRASAASLYSVPAPSESASPDGDEAPRPTIPPLPGYELIRPVHDLGR